MMFILSGFRLGDAVTPVNIERGRHRSMDVEASAVRDLRVHENV